MAENDPTYSAKQSVWREIIFPAATGIERFFWNLVWFLVLMCILFSFNPFRKETSVAFAPCIRPTSVDSGFC